MSVERVNPRELYAGTPYDYASVAPAGGIVFTAGACPLDADGTVVAPGDFEAQTRQTLDNLATALAAAGSSLEQVLKTTGRDRSDRAALTQAVESPRGGSSRSGPVSRKLAISAPTGSSGLSKGDAQRLG